MVDLIYCSSF
ncbi:hypothetical protein FWK35_00017748 [Aphis craccivora]|uniref:Uncharacterized protein n=1 Tax=Aphis craccivora TaxID=307492 RepID=A0A6G0Z347_APHCR|nr:hypothetical protein FWK35_00017748 [Aphis craccivora]